MTLLFPAGYHRSLSSIQSMVGLVWRVQYGFTHLPGTLARDSWKADLPWVPLTLWVDSGPLHEIFALG